MRDGGGELGQKLRYDGVWWRKFAALGATYGPEWWKRYSPPMIGATCFALYGTTEDAQRAASSLPVAWWRHVGRFVSR